MCVAFALQKLLTFFQQKISAYFVSLHVNFNESLTNDVVSFEQLGLGLSGNFDFIGQRYQRFTVKQQFLQAH